MTTIWTDLSNLPEVHVTEMMMKRFTSHNFIITTRNYAGMPDLIKKITSDFLVIGEHPGKGFLAKASGHISRTLSLIKRLPPFDVAFGFPYIPLVHTANFRRRPVIIYTDNDFFTWSAFMSLKFSDHILIPNSIDPRNILRLGASSDTLYGFNGFKEDLYIADYVPDPNFLDNIPFKEYVVVRPEALKAEYVSTEAKTIVPDLLRRLEKEDMNILYLPRYPEDKLYAKNIKNIHIPSSSINGLDACYYSKGVLTGSGTFAREAAILGIPSVSFYPDPELLSVDKEMIRCGWMIHSRDPKEIISYLVNTRKKEFNPNNCKKVQNEVLDMIEKMLWDVGTCKK